MIKLEPVVQVALDLTDIEDALEIGEQADEGGVDWIEAGTPLIKSEGLSSVERLSQRFPDKKIVADMKIMDTGELETGLAGEVGADVVSVLGASADETVKGAVKAGKEYELDIIADLIAVKEPSVRAQELEKLGVDYIGVHVGIDQQEAGGNPLKQAGEIINSTSTPIAVAGGLNAETVPKAVEAGASIVVVGSAITKAENPTEASKEIVDSIREVK